MAKRASMKDRQPVPVMSEDALHLVDAVMDAPAGERIKLLPVEQIDRDENQPRQTFDEEELQELADSIRAKGVQQPIGVRPVEDRYRIIWGERRWRATKIAGQETIPAIIRNVDEGEAYELSLIENLQREDLDPLEEAYGLAELCRRRNYTQEQAAEAIGKSRSQVSKLIGLTKLSQSVKSKCATSHISRDQWFQIATQKTEKAQLDLADRILAGGLNVRETRKAASGKKGPKGTEVRKEHPEVVAVKRFREKLGKTRWQEITGTDREQVKGELQGLAQEIERVVRQL